MKFGRTRFYAEECVEEYLVKHIRDQGFHVVHAHELGFSARDDEFHFVEAQRRRCVLLSRDKDYLDDRRFPWSRMKTAAVVVLATSAASSEFGYALAALKDSADSGTRNLHGLKIEIVGSRMKLSARIRGRVRTDVVDLADDAEDYRYLFAD